MVEVRVEVLALWNVDAEWRLVVVAGKDVVDVAREVRVVRGDLG